MKNIKKLLALVIVLVIAFTMAIPAFADDYGTITIQNATAGKAYAAYKIFDATVSGDNVAYTIKSSSKWYPTVAAATTLFTLTATGTTGVYSVVPAANKNSEINALFAGKFSYTDGAWTCTVTDAAPEASKSPATDGTVKLTVPYGYYYVTSSLGSNLTVDTAKPNVTIIDKNQGPSWDNDIPDDETTTGVDEGETGVGKVIIEDGKKLKANTANYGDEVTFDIGINATNFDGTEMITYYYIADTLDTGFTLPTSFEPTVKVGTMTLTKASTLNGLTGNQYYLYQDGNTFDIVINWADVVTSGTKSELKSLYANAVEIHVTYSATVNNNAEIGDNGNPNTAKFTWDKTADDPNTTDVDESYDPENPPTEDPNPKDPGDPDGKPTYPGPSKTTETYVYAIGFTKLDGDNNALAGAQFKLAGTTKLSGSEGVYYYDKDNGTAGKVLDCDSNGKLVIKGLDAGTYTLNETKAPDGYNINTSDIVFEVSAFADDVDSTTFAVPVADKDSLVNNKGTELPETGGVGTVIFTIVGVVVILAAGIFLVTNKRMRKEMF